MAFLQSNSSTADLTTYTFSGENLGDADADRHIIIDTTSRAAGAATLVSVSVGGVAASIGVQAADGGNSVGSAIAHVPSGTTGDVVVTWSGARLRCTIAVHRLIGVDSTTPYDTATSTTQDPSGAVDVPDGGYVTGVACMAGANTATWSGVTERYDLQPESTFSASGGSDVFASAQTVNIQCTFVGTDAQDVGVFASWAPAAASAESPPPMLPLLMVG